MGAGREHLTVGAAGNGFEARLTLVI